MAGSISACAIGRAALRCVVWPGYASRNSHVDIETLYFVQESAALASPVSSSKLATMHALEFCSR